MAAAVEGWVLGGVLPETAFAGYMGAEVGVAAPFAFRVGALGTTTVDTAIEPGSAAVSLVALRVDGCLSRAVWPAGRLGARACVGVAGGEVFAQGRGFHRSLATEILWAAAVAQLDVEIAILPAVALRLSAQGLLPLVRPRLEVARPSGDLAATRGFSRVGGGVGLGLAWRFR